MNSDRRLVIYAAKLGGVVAGRDILCPSPGRREADRTCRVRINPDNPGGFYIYDCEGDLEAAYAVVRAKLGLRAPVPITKALALRVWNETQPAAGTAVEVYLRERAIALSLPPDLHFHTSLWHRDGRLYWPAMVSARRDVYGEIVAVHRTWLAHDGKGKAPLDEPKKDYGASSGTAIRLAPVAAELAVAEGIETALSVMQLTGHATWAAGSAPMLRVLDLPPQVQRVIVYADGDTAGRNAARAAATRWQAEGRRVFWKFAPEGSDFNDLLRERSQ